MFIDELVAGSQNSELSPADRVMLDYVVKLTLKPDKIVLEDVNHLRDAGFDDRAIHDICAITRAHPIKAMYSNIFNLYPL